MRDLTMHELDAQLAEQLPARELMQSHNTATAIAANVSEITQVNVALFNNGDVTQSNSAEVYQDAAAVALAGNNF